MCGEPHVLQDAEEQAMQIEGKPGRDAEREKGTREEKREKQRKKRERPYMC